MTDRRQDDRLSALLDGELSATETAELQTELAADADLRAALAELSDLRNDLASLPRVKLSDDFSARVVRAAVAAQQAQQASGVVAPARRPARLAAWSAGLLASAALVLVVLSWSGLIPGFSPAAPNQPIAEGPAAPPAAVAALRSQLPGEGEALVIRLEADDPRLMQRLSQSLAQRGVGERSASDLTTAAADVGRVFREQLRAAPNQAAPLTAATGAIYVEAPLAELEDALAELSAEAGELRLQPASLVALAPKPNTGSPGEGEGEFGNAGKAPAPVAPFVQQLNPRLFKLPAASEQPSAAPVAGNHAPSADPNRKVRVLILLETTPAK